jgi:hypothetical protein
VQTLVFFGYRTGDVLWSGIGKGFERDLLAKPVEPEDLLALLSPIASELDS